MRRLIHILTVLLILAGFLPGQSVFPAHFSPEHRNLVVMYDVYPHLLRLSETKAFKHLEIALAEPGLIHQLDPGNVPVEVAIGTPPESLRDSILFVDAIAHVMLAMSVDVDNPEEQPLLAELQQTLAERLMHLRVPEATIYIRMRDRAGAMMLRNLLFAPMGYLNQTHNLQLRRQGQTLTFSYALNEVLMPETLVGHLETLQVMSDPHTEDNQKLIAHILSLGIYGEIRQIDDGVLIRIAGKPIEDAQVGISPEQLPSVFLPAENLLLAGQWDFGPVKQLAHSWREGIVRWQNTPLAKDIEARNALETYITMFDEILLVGDRGEIRFWVEEGIRGTIDESNVPTGVALHDSPLARLITPEMALYNLGGERNLGQFLRSHWRDLMDNIVKFTPRENQHDQDFDAEAYLNELPF